MRKDLKCGEGGYLLALDFIEWGLLRVLEERFSAVCRIRARLYLPGLVSLKGGLLEVSGY